MDFIDGTISVISFLTRSVVPVIVVLLKTLVVVFCFPFMLILSFFYDGEKNLILLKKKRYLLFALLTPIMAICYAVCIPFNFILSKEV